MGFMSYSRSGFDDTDKPFVGFDDNDKPFIGFDDTDKSDIFGFDRRLRLS